MSSKYRNFLSMQSAEFVSEDNDFFRFKKIFQSVCVKSRQTKWKKTFKKHESFFLNFRKWFLSMKNDFHLNVRDYTLSFMFRDSMRRKLQLKNLQINFLIMWMNNDSHLLILNVLQSEKARLWYAVLTYFNNSSAAVHIIRYTLQIVDNSENTIFKHENSFFALTEFMKISENKNVEMIKNVSIFKNKKISNSWQIF